MEKERIGIDEKGVSNSTSICVLIVVWMSKIRVLECPLRELEVGLPWESKVAGEEWSLFRYFLELAIVE